MVPTCICTWLLIQSLLPLTAITACYYGYADYCSSIDLSIPAPACFHMTAAADNAPVHPAVASAAAATAAAVLLPCGWSPAPSINRQEDAAIHEVRKCIVL